MLTACLLAAALAAGVTGAWSPCGFSMVETLAPHGYARRLRTSIAACATFAVGALAGGAMTFGGLALVGAALGAGGPVALGIAAVVALAAAAAEARGLRIAPQIRRQVPEAWRRVLPVPLAAAGYGVLLGLGFTTFVLSFAVWALAGTSIALGDPALGLAMGLAFGAGRALPVIVLAPFAGTERGGARDRGDVRAARDPARPAPRRRARAGGVRGGAGRRADMTRRKFALFAGSAYDPTAAGGLVAWQRPNGTALLLRGGRARALPGSHPALGGGRIAWRDGEDVTIAEASTLDRIARHTAGGAGSLAVSDTLLAWRTRDIAGTDRVWVSEGGGDQIVLESGAPTELGRPAIAGAALLCHTAGPAGSRLLHVDLATGVQQVLREQVGAQITNPATDGSRLLYVHATGQVQQLRLGPLAPADPAADRVLLVQPSPGQRDREHERGRHRHRQGYHGHRPPLPPRAARGVVGTLWTTALDPANAYVTRLRAVKGGPRSADVLSVPAPP